MCCDPANGRVDFEEWSAYKIQLNGIEWIVSLSADWDQSPKKTKKKQKTHNYHTYCMLGLILFCVNSFSDRQPAARNEIHIVNSSLELGGFQTGMWNIKTV
jgi:hypothetical protein